MSSVAILPEVKKFLEKVHGHFINGQYTSSESGKITELFNPATGKVLASVQHTTLDDLNQAVEIAHQSFIDRRWSGMRPADREKVLFRLSELLLEHGEVLAQLETLNQGKSIHISRNVEVGATAEYIRYMAGWVTKITGETFDVSIAVPANSKYTAFTQREPIGVVAAIAPWNFPLSIAAWKSIPALVAGCSVVLKPSLETPLTALYLAKLAHEAGIPAGVFNVVIGSGSTIGQALIEHPLVRKITFTGSTEVGKGIGQAAMKRLTQVSLELGGKNPMIILDDVPVNKAVEGILMGGFFNSGQVCAAASRIYVQRKIFDQVQAQLISALNGMKIGSGLDESAQIQPVISLKQQQSILKHIQTAKDQGATIACGGKTSQSTGFFIEPTVITQTKPTDCIIKDEVFGPVITLTPFDEVEKVVELANDSDFGLTASVWTNDLQLVMTLIPKIQAGTVWVNSHIPLDPAMPFGGFKQSGIGREFGKASVESFTEVKSVCIAH